VLLLVTAAVEYRTCQQKDEVADVWVLRKAGLVCVENWLSVSLVRRSRRWCMRRGCST